MTVSYNAQITVPNKQGDFKTKEELYSTHDEYKAHEKEWYEYDLVYKSGRPLIEYSLYQHPLESDSNYTSRLRDGYVMNFGRAIVNIFSFYLNEKETVRILPGLEDETQWQMFLKDCDLTGTDYDMMWNEAGKITASMGTIGILVNKAGFNLPGSEGGKLTVDDEIEHGIYPYYSLYNVLNVLDWEFEKNLFTHRYELIYLKLRESDGTITIWRQNSWERWDLKPNTSMPEIIDAGENPLGEIPFVWFVNMKDLGLPNIGESDLVDIAPIIFSIAQNLSCGEETIKLAGFPIRRQPLTPEDMLMEEGADEEVASGPRAVEYFDPTHGNAAKPDWMPTEIAEPIEAMIRWIDRKIDEIYRVAHLSGVHAQRKSNNKVASGLSIRYEFAQLNSVLMAKARNQLEAEMQALRFWLMWQDKEELFRDMEMKRSREFSIDEMAVALDNAIAAMAAVASDTFSHRVQQKIANATLPDLSQKDKDIIYNEIETSTTEEPEEEPEEDPDDIPTATGTNVRNAKQAFADHSKDEM